MPEISVVRGLR